MAGFGMACDVVIALAFLDPSEDGVVGSPGAPDEIGERQGDGDADPLQDAEDDHADRGGGGEEELAAPDLEQPAHLLGVEELDCGADDDGGQRDVGQMVQESAGEREHRDDEQRSGHAHELALSTRWRGQPRCGSCSRSLGTPGTDLSPRWSLRERRSRGWDRQVPHLPRPSTSTAASSR